jgi:hypothetical protein
MKLKNLSAFLLLILPLLSSCHLILKKVCGIHNPRIEQEASIEKAARKYHLKTDNILTASPDGMLHMSKRGIPDVAIFDGAGDYIEYRATDTSCNAGVFGFIPALHKEGQYNKTHNTTLSEEMAMIRTMAGSPINKAYLKPKADFYLFIYWATYEGRLNKDHVKAWEDLAMKNKNANIQVIKVDLDLQRWWPQQSTDSVIAVMEGKSDKN